MKKKNLTNVGKYDIVCCLLVTIVSEVKSTLGQTDSQVDASQRKFAKPELAIRLAMGSGQTDSQVGSQVHASRRKP